MSTGHAAAVVLLVEEETQQREAITAYLEQEGFVVLESATSDDAMEHLENRPDIRAVVTDAHVPGAGGADFPTIVRQSLPQVALVMMSGHSDAMSGDVPEGAVFLSKPNLLEYLAPTLHRLIRATRR